MKGILITIGGIIGLMSSIVGAQPNTQVMDPQQMTQDDWIEHSFDRGEVNRREGTQLNQEQDRVDRKESREKTDRVVTKKESARIGAAQKRTPRPIVRERHARQRAPHR